MIDVNEKPNERNGDGRDAFLRYRMTDHKRNEDFRNSTYRNGQTFAKNA
jgi:hypothetical protein